MYHANGQLEDRGTYANGQLGGRFESYYENGELRARTNYIRGIPQ